MQDVRGQPTFWRVIYRVATVSFAWMLALQSGIVATAEVPEQITNARDAVSEGAPIPKPITEITVDTRVDGEIPVDQSEVLFTPPVPLHRGAMGRTEWTDVNFWWASSEFTHRPLYFDQVPLERCGHSRIRILQPAISGIHFFGTAAVLPYKMLVDFPFRQVSQLGAPRPGTYAYPFREGWRGNIYPIWLVTVTALYRSRHCHAESTLR